MNPKRRQRLIFVGVILAGVSTAAALAIAAIGNSMLYYSTPSQLTERMARGEIPPRAEIRLGGMVVTGSVARSGEDLGVDFDLTDHQATVSVSYTGILPDLFREGQGIVARGRVTPNGVFHASEVLAKHDENYMPPEVAEVMEIVKKSQSEASVAPPSQPVPTGLQP